MGVTLGCHLFVAVNTKTFNVGENGEYGGGDKRTINLYM